MEIIKIGRSSSNDVIIDDSLVSRVHCQIIRDDNGNFRLIDVNSKNGTFINGTKRHGEVRLNTSDIVRIGNTILPWQMYFHQKGGTLTTPTDDRTITIGRQSWNDVVVNDPYVSSSHCKITQSSNGSCWLTDSNSKNGTYLNGGRIQGTVRLDQNDVVRIGNTTLSWQNYFTFTRPVPNPNPDPVPDPPVHPPIGPGEPQQSGLGTIALILSLVGTGILIYCAIQTMKWGIFAFVGNTSTLTIVSFALNVIACILASIADYNDHKDSDAASIAEWLSGCCIMIVIGFYLYLKFGDSNILNPLKDAFN